MGSTQWILLDNDFPTLQYQLCDGFAGVGKSTLLRSVAAVCLIATTGLLVPARRADIPFLDNIVVRAFIGDNPREKESSHSLEMLELASVLREASQDSLVLLDELGRGTGIHEGALCHFSPSMISPVN